MANDVSAITVEELIKQGVLEKPLDGNHGGIHPKGNDFIETGIPFIMASDMVNGEIDTVGCKFITEQQARSLRKGFAKTGDVLLSHKATIGRTALVGKIDTDFVMLTPQVTYYRVKNDAVLNNRYLKYYFDSRDFQDLFNLWAGGGSTRAYLGITGQMKLPVKVPPIARQKYIASVLGTLDDKIQLNRQTNQTLESMAQALFKSWFVDFDLVIDNALAAGNAIPEPLQARAEERKALQCSSDALDGQAVPQLPEAIRQLFPNSFVLDAEMGWIPEGWMIGTINEATSLIIDHRGKTPKKLSGDWSETGHPAISAKNIKSGRIVREDTIRFVDDDLYHRWMREPLQPGDIALTSEAPLGELFYFADKYDYLLSQRLYGLRANPDICSGSFLYFWLQSELAWSDMEGRATGTTVVGIRQSELRKVAVLLPSKAVIDEYSRIADDFLRQIEGNNSQTGQLEAIRNTLLPKLISGELRIPEAAQAAQELETTTA